MTLDFVRVAIPALLGICIGLGGGSISTTDAIAAQLACLGLVGMLWSIYHLTHPNT